MSNYLTALRTTSISKLSRIICRPCSHTIRRSSSILPERIHYAGDKLGRLALSIDGLRERDSYVLRECYEREIPVVTVMSGGYGKDINDTIEIHCNTIRMVKNVFETPSCNSTTRLNVIRKSMRRLFRIFFLAVLGVTVGIVGYEGIMFVRVLWLRNGNPSSTSLIDTRIKRSTSQRPATETRTGVGAARQDLT